MKIFRKGDRVYVQGKKFPGVVISTKGSKVSVRTDDHRSLVNINSDLVDLIKTIAVKK